MRLCEYTKIIPLIEPQDHQSAGIDGDSFCMKNYGHATIIFLFGELEGNSDLVIYEGEIADDKDAAITFAYRKTTVDLLNAGADTLDTEATSASLELTATTFEDRMLVVEIDGKQLTDGMDWITVEVDSDANPLFISAVAILSEPRYAQDVPPTAIS